MVRRHERERTYGYKPIPVQSRARDRQPEEGTRLKAGSCSGGEPDA